MEFNSRKFKAKKKERRACRSFRQNWTQDESTVDWVLEQEERENRIGDTTLDSVED